MSKIFRTLSALGIVAAMVLVPTIADAAPGRAVSVANVRSGPGTGYPVVAQLSADQYVVVVKCTINWCQVKRTGKNGWVSRKLLYNPYYFSEGESGYKFAPKGVDVGR